MENVRNLVNEIRTGLTQKSSSQKDEVRVMKAMLNDRDYVVDVYNNTIINKDGFYYMKHPKIINCINNKDLKNDKTFIKELKNLKHFLEIYLSSRNEITKDLQKNLFLW